MTDTYFDLLGMSQSFEIDLQQLKSNNLRLQQTLHPDRYLHETTSQQMVATNKLAEVNQAFQTLKSGYTRGEYLLSLLGVKKPDESQTIKNPALLMEQMELREELSEIRQQHDPESLLESFSARVKQLVKLQNEKVSSLFENIDNDDYDISKLNPISDALVKLRFLEKLQQEIIRFEEQLDEY